MLNTFGYLLRAAVSKRKDTGPIPDYFSNSAWALIKDYFRGEYFYFCTDSCFFTNFN